MSQRKQFIDGVKPNSPRRKLDDFDTKPDSRQPRIKRRQKKSRLSNSIEGMQSLKPDAIRASGGGTSKASHQSAHRLQSVSMDNPPELDYKRSRIKFIDKRRRKKAEKKARKAEKPPSKLRKIAKRSAIGLSILLVGYFGFVFLKAWTSFGSIIDRAGAGSPVLGASVTPTELRGEGDGRVNVLLIGIGGENHPGGELSDTILVASVDPIAHEAGLLSIPRDLYVTIPGNGQTKINAAHAYGEQIGFQEPGYPEDGPGLLQKTLESTLGIPLHYYVRVDFTGFKEAVDAVGGIDITLEERVYDPIFNREYGYGALDIGPGEVHLDGQTALLLGRARGSIGGVGLSASDFDRGEHQRLMLMALKDKALSVSTYTDPTTIIKLLDALGGHVRTNLQIGDMLRLKEIGENISATSIISYGLDTSADSFLTSDNIGGLAVLVPRDGTFAAVQNFVRSIFVDGFIKSENAQLDILNGTTQPGLASEHAAELETYGYNINEIGNAHNQQIETTSLYAMNALNPYTKNYLEQRYGLTALSAEQLPSQISTQSDFVLILGSDVVEQDQT